MRQAFLAALYAIVTGLGAAPAHAGTLTSATWATEFPGLQSGAPIAVPVSATGTSTSSSLSVSLILPAFSVGAFGTSGVINTYRQLTLSGAQSLTATAGMAVATKGVPGSWKVKAALHTAGSMLTPANPTLLRVPLSVGVNGATTLYFQISGSYHYVTVDFYAWTAGTRTFTGLTSLGMALPSEVAMGSFNVTAMGGGHVLLVSPSKLSLDGPLGQQRSVSLTTLKLTFVPEPGAWLMLGAGALALLRFRRQS